MNLVNEISSMESALESLRSENKILSDRNMILDFENDQLKRRLAQVEEARDRHLAREVRLKTLLDQAGRQLVAGINGYNNETGDLLGGTATAEAPRMIEGEAK